MLTEVYCDNFICDYGAGAYIFILRLGCFRRVVAQDAD